MPLAKPRGRKSASSHGPATAAPSVVAAMSPRAALACELASQYVAGQPVSVLLALADDAASAGDDAAEQVALSMAAERIHSGRETYAGLAGITRRLLGKPIADVSTLDIPLRWWPSLGRFLALLFAEQHDEVLQQTATSLLQSITHDPFCAEPHVAVTRLTIARHLLGYADLKSDEAILVQLDAIAVEAMRLIAADNVAVSLWWGERAVIGSLSYSRQGRDYARLEKVIAGAEAHLARYPHGDTQFKLLRVRLDIANTANDRVGAQSALAEMPQHIGSNKKVNLVIYLRSRGFFALEHGSGVDAERDLSQALELAESIEAPPPVRLALTHLLATTLFVQNRLRDGCAVLEQARSYTAASQMHFIDSLAATAASAACWDQDRDAAVQLLRDGLGTYRRAARHLFLRSTPELAAITAARALQYGIETEFVAESIRRREMQPPGRAVECWPWAIRIHLFGGFALQRKNHAAASNGRGKAQQKPIAILRALALLGPRGGDRRALARRVWRGVDPDEQGDALDMGIGRARKLLGDDSLIQVQDGRIFLDDKRVFVDTWAFDEIEQVIRDTERQPPSRLRMEELGQQLIALYVGRLFDDDDSLTASAILIEQFRERFINMVTLLARALARHDLRGAMDLLQRAIEREPYSERLYRSLIEQLANAGEYAEAMRWYRRCQHAVSQAYGVAISPNTEALLALIRMPPPNPPVES